MGDNLVLQQFPRSIDAPSAAPLNMARGLCSLNMRSLLSQYIMSSKTPDPLANRAFTIGAPLHSMAGAGLKT